MNKDVNPAASKAAFLFDDLSLDKLLHSMLDNLLSSVIYDIENVSFDITFEKYDCFVLFL